MYQIAYNTMCVTKKRSITNNISYNDFNNFCIKINIAKGETVVEIAADISRM